MKNKILIGLFLLVIFADIALATNDSLTISPVAGFDDTPPVIKTWIQRIVNWAAMAGGVVAAIGMLYFLIISFKSDSDGSISGKNDAWKGVISIVGKIIIVTIGIAFLMYYYWK